MYKIHHLNIKDWKSDELFDAVLCDPPYELGFMGKGWDSSGIAFDVEMWRNIYNHLKPGGHLLAFSGSRTYHRMAVAIEDAGFEIRDMIEWVYGSGFPKSHNIGKNIEKIKVGGIKNLKQIGTKKGIKVETGTHGFSYSKEYVAGKSMGGKQISGDIPVYEINNEWEGWGTALKPAHEPCVLARKPMIDPDVDLTETVRRAIIDTGLTEEIQWNNVSVTGVEKSRQLTYLSSTHLLRTAETYAKRVKSKQTTDTENDTESSYAKEQKNDTKKDQTTTSNTEKSLPNDLKTKSLTPTVTSANVAESQSGHSSRLTTSTVAVGSTEKATTAKYIQNLGDKGFLLDTELFAGTVTGLTDLATPVLIARNSDGTYTYPKELPRIIKGGSNTVANNVLKHGTGGLNIDGTRVGVESIQVNRHSGYNSNSLVESTKGKWKGESEQVTGRFPANLIHDGSDEVEAVFPQTKSGKAGIKTRHNIGFHSDNEIYGNGVGSYDCPEYGDSGSASRYFYTAKASKSERNLGLDSTVSIRVQLEICENNITRQENLAQLQVVMDNSHLKATAESGIGTKSGTEWSMSLFGNQYTEKYPINTKSTTKTTTSSTTTSVILNWLIGLLTNESTLGVNLEMASGGSLVESAESSNTLIATINDQTALALGVNPAQANKRLLISVSDGKNFHSTVKPLSLTKYLATLIKPPTGGRLLVPFSGSGSEMIGALQAGWEYVEGVELTEEYIPIAEARIKYWLEQTDKQEKLL